MALVSGGQVTHVPHDTWPLACKVKSVQGNKASVLWYTGRKTTPWSLVERELDNGGTLPWEEDILLDDIYFHSFLLTPASKLPKCAQEECDMLFEYLHH